MVFPFFASFGEGSSRPSLSQITSPGRESATFVVANTLSRAVPRSVGQDLGCRDSKILRASAAAIILAAGTSFSSGAVVTTMTGRPSRSA